MGVLVREGRIGWVGCWRGVWGSGRYHDWPSEEQVEWEYMIASK